MVSIEMELTPRNSKYHLPDQMCVMEVTPEMASDWLSYRRHPDLRPLSVSVSGRYQKDMEEGRWREATPEGLVFDTEGWIISGQHRLKAQANSGKTLQWRIFPGEPRDIAPFLDAGFRRTAAHLIRVPHAVAVANAGRYMAALADADRYGLPRYGRVTVPETLAAFQQWPEIAWHARLAHQIQVYANIPAGAHLAVLAQAERTDYRDAIPPWLDGLKTGFNLPEGDARAYLRNRFGYGLKSLGRRNQREMSYAMIVKAWNLYAQELPVGKGGLRWGIEEKLPQVVGATNEEEK